MQFLKSAALVPIAAMLVGCSDPVSLPTEIFGTYVLQSVNDHMVPAKGDELTYVSGTVTLSADGTVERTNTYRFTPEGADQIDSRNERYTYWRGGIYAEGSNVLLATIDGDELQWLQLLPADGYDVLLYERQPPVE